MKGLDGAARQIARLASAAMDEALNHLWPMPDPPDPSTAGAAGPTPPSPADAGTGGGRHLHELTWVLTVVLRRHLSKQLGISGAVAPVIAKAAAEEILAHFHLSRADR